MSAHVTTASTVALRRACSYWMRDEVVHEDSTHRAQTNGDDFHDDVNAHVSGEEEESGSEVAARMMMEIRPRIEELRERGCEVLSEVAIAWNPQADTARVLAVGQARDYSRAMPGEFCGTIDLVVIDEPNKAVTIYDWKTAPPGVTPKDATDQLVANAIAVSRAFAARCPDFDIAYAAVTVREDGAHWAEPVELSVFDLEAAAADLRDLLATPYADAQPQPGPHCKERYCKARGTCPATTHAAPLSAASLVKYGPPRPFGIPIESDEHAAWLLTACDLIEGGLDAERKRAKAYADRVGGVTYPDGSVWKGRESKSARPLLEVPGAVDVVRAAGAEDAIGYSTTWAEIARVIGKENAASLRETLTEMRAVKSTSFKTYTRTKAPKIKLLTTTTTKETET